MNESRFKCQVVAELKKQLPGCYHYHPSDKWNSGVPDILILYKGIFAAIELKVGKNKATKIQLVTLEKIRSAGGIVAVCYDLKSVREVIYKIETAANKREVIDQM